MALAYDPLFIASENSSLQVTSPPPSPLTLTQDELKRIAAYKAVEFVESGMVLGLGTGSTAKHAVDRIGQLLRQGKLQNIVGIPTSKVTQEQAVSVGIPLSDLESHPVIDLSIDGADEVDPDLNLVKGRGGSLLREKMIEGASKKFVVIVDESKLVKHIGGSKLALPVEIVPFCWKFIAEKLRELLEHCGCAAKLRLGETGKVFVTDNGNYIVDLYLEKEIGDLRATSDAILRLPGVVEHGMFLDMASTVIIAGKPSDVSNLAFEAKSARDFSWSDVSSFITYRILPTAELEVRVRFSGFDNQHFEWVNVKTSVRERSNHQSVGELMLETCFYVSRQEREDQALYCDAHVVNIRRRIHDHRRCNCVFLVHYEHDNTEEPLGVERICPRPGE